MTNDSPTQAAAAPAAEKPKGSRNIEILQRTNLGTGNSTVQIAFGNGESLKSFVENDLKEPARKFGLRIVVEEMPAEEKTMKATEI
jgi:hypothetical protein